MSAYDQQLAALTGQYQQFMSKLPGLGISSASVEDLQNAIQKQIQIQALTQQYQTAQNQLLSNQTKQQATDISKSGTLSKQAKSSKDALGSITNWYEALNTPTNVPGVANTAPSTPKLTPDQLFQWAQTISKDKKFYNVTGTTGSIVEDVLRNYAGDPDSLSKQAKDLQGSALGLQASIASATPGLPKIKSQLAEESSTLLADEAKLGKQKNALALQQFQNREQQTQKAPTGQASGVASSAKQAVASTPNAPKGVAAFNALTPTGMPADNVQQAAQKANQTGEPSSPFRMPTMSGLTFGGN